VNIHTILNFRASRTLFYKFREVLKKRSFNFLGQFIFDLNNTFWFILLKHTIRSGQTVKPEKKVTCRRVL